MRFSIIIPLYNKAAYVGKTIASVLEQSFVDFELLIVDDGSTDQSLQVARTYENNQVKIIAKANGGTASARNAGIAASQGDYLCFLDGDDYWLPNFLESIDTLITKFPQAGIYTTKYKFERKGKRYFPNYHAIEKKEAMFLVPNYFTSVLHGSQIAIPSSAAVPKKVLQHLGGYNEAMRYTEDQELWNRIAMHYPVAMHSTVAAIYRQDAANMKTKRLPKHEIEFAVCLQQQLNANEVPAEYIEQAKKIVAANLIGVASLNLLAGDKKTAKKFLNDPRTNEMPERKAAWERLLPLPTFFVKSAYRLRELIQQRKK